MPLLLQKHIDDNTRMAVWKIEEDELFFLQKVQLQQAVHHPHKRLQHLAGRYLLSWLVIDFPYEEIRLTEAGKPYLPSGAYQFSISHCGDYAAVIISSESRCGIDIELFSAKTETVKSKYLSQEEQTYIHSLRSRHPSLFSDYQLYTLCWCAKEAVYKWWGEGKVDFRKHISIRSIHIEEKILTAFFSLSSVEWQLTLHMLLLAQLSVVWTVDSKKTLNLANAFFE